MTLSISYHVVKACRISYPICTYRIRTSIYLVEFSRSSSCTLLTMMPLFALLFLPALVASAVQCAGNASAVPPLTAAACPAGASCCRATFWGPYKCRTGSECDVCAECCHDELSQNQSSCDACVRASCPPDSFGQWGCRDRTQLSGANRCCPPGRPLAPSTALPNCLLIGDSVTNGMAPLVAKLMASECQVQHIEGVDAASEHTCFWSQGTVSAATGERVQWDVIHFNEGLHSLWPRVNTSAQQTAWALQLANFTSVLAATGASLVYATMTPYMPEKYLNPPGPARDDVETKNALAVRTVRAAGVTQINDLYSVVTSRCGQVYQNCSICDDESQYHAPYTGQCGYHYVQAGWALLANATVTALREALAGRRRQAQDR